MYAYWLLNQLYIKFATMYNENKCCYEISVEWYTTNKDGNDEREKYIEIIGNGFDTRTAIEIIANNLYLNSGSHVVKVDIKDGSRREYASPLLSIRYESFSKNEMTLSIDNLRCTSYSNWNQTCKEIKAENENLRIIKCLDVAKNEAFYEWSINKEQINESEYLKNLPHFNSENLNRWVVHYLDFYPDKYNIIIKPNVDLSDKESFILFMIDFIDLLRKHDNSNYNSWLHLDTESMISEITLADKKIKFKKRAKKIIDNYRNIIFETIRFSTIHIYPFDNNIINIYLESFPRIQRQYSERVILKEFKMDSQEKIKEFMSFIFNIGIYKFDSIKQINTLILTYHTILNDYIFEEDIEKRKDIINSYYPVFIEEEKFLLSNGFLTDEFIKLSNDLIQEHDVNLVDFNCTNTYTGSTIYKGEYFLMKHQQEEKITIPDISNTYELYDFQYKYLLAEKGIKLSKFMLRDMIHNICFKHNLDRLCFFKEYQAILKIRKETKVHKELFESFRVKNAPYDYRYRDNEPNNPFDSYDVEDRDWIRQSYNEYYGYSGEGWVDTSDY